MTSWKRKTLQESFKDWRKQPLKKLKIYEANIWTMMSEFGQGEYYKAEHLALRRFIANYEEFHRKVSKESEEKQRIADRLRKYNMAVKNKDWDVAETYALFLNLTIHLSK